ncbi:MAG: class I SAM-dependent methyltransferase [Verrucomicrobiota bacterium]
MSDPTDPYSEISYESSAYPQSHPDNLAVVATLFGMQPRTLEGARVLEIGCAGGGNLLPLAAAWPGSRFVGIDPSPRHIAEAQAGVAALQLTNVTFHAMRLEDFGSAYGTFDYIIAHGVYSWVPAPVRDQLLALCARLLTPMGVAYVSFNTLPGSGTRATLREMVKFHTRRAPSPPERVSQARTFFSFLEAALKDRDDAYARSMGEELSQIARLGDFYIAHEHLEETNAPCYFHEFIEHAQRHGLQFLGEAEIQSMSTAGFPVSVQAGMREMASGVEEAEQYGDFVRNRAFRQTLLCRSDTILKRTVSPDLVQRFHFASSLQPMPEDGGGGTGFARQFRDADGRSMEVRDGLAGAALLELQAVWPGSMAFEELLARASQRAAVPAGPGAAAVLGNTLLKCYSVSRGMEFQLCPRGFYPAVSDFPLASPLARWQASRGCRVTNQRHENVLLGPAEKALLDQLDGRQRRADLEAQFQEAGSILEHFARVALLVS